MSGGFRMSLMALSSVAANRFLSGGGGGSSAKEYRTLLWIIGASLLCKNRAPYKATGQEPLTNKGS
jgi:hypothetical protein